MKNLLKDQDYAFALNKMGFCVLPLFNEKQIADLQQVYDENFSGNQVSGLIASHSKTQPDNSLKISDSIKTILFPSLEKWFENYSFFLGGFMVKEANTNSEFPLHQDWNILDESKYKSYQVWIPLELSSPYNGGIYVFPGSHLFFNNNRSGSYGMPRIERDASIERYLVDMVIPPGSALVYHNSLFHASFPNNTSKNRISVIINVYEKNAPLTYFHKNLAQKCTEQYSIDTPLFLSNLSILEKGEIPVNFKQFTNEPLDTINNAELNSSDLIDGFNRHFANNIEGFEPRQLQIVKDPSISERLYKDGYIVLDFIDSDKIRDLNEEYNRLFQTSKTAIGRFTPMEHTNPESKRYIHEFIIQKIKEELDQYFIDYQTPIASYFVKYANSPGDLSWHNDASILLNTHLEPHLGIWCPLLDVNEENGAFCLIEKSHKYCHSVFLDGLQWPFLPYDSLFNQTKKIIPLKAGQIVLFDLRLIHHAMPNKTIQDRIVFCVRLTHLKSKYYSFKCLDYDTNSITVFEEYPDYYLRDDWSSENQASNQVKKIGTMNQIYNSININQFNKYK